jgi:hypothetical protein
MTRLNAEPADAALDAELGRMEKEHADKEERLATISAAAAGVDDKARDKMMKKLADLVKEWSKRRLAFRDIADSISEAMEKKMKDFYKYVGLKEGVDEAEEHDIKDYNEYKKWKPVKAAGNRR